MSFPQVPTPVGIAGTKDDRELAALFPLPAHFHEHGGGSLVDNDWNAVQLELIVRWRRRSQKSPRHGSSRARGHGGMDQQFAAVLQETEIETKWTPVCHDRAHRPCAASRGEGVGHPDRAISPEADQPVSFVQGFEVYVVVLELFGDREHAPAGRPCNFYEIASPAGVTRVHSNRTYSFFVRS